MHRRRLWPVAALVLVVALGLVTTASARVNHPAAPKVKTGGTLLFGAEQEPPCLNSQWLNDCNNTWAFYVQQLVLRSAFLTKPDFSYVPDLITKATLKLNPQRVTYYLRKNAKWNDGKQVTATDFIFTWKTDMNKAWDSKPTGGGIVSRSGYDQIKGISVKAGTGGKVFTVTFKPNYADWKDVFGSVLPQHALAGTDFSKDFINDFTNPKNGKQISDGPFVFSSWQHGSQLTMVRNPTWWGPHKAYLKSFTFRYLTNSNTEIQAVKAGDVDAIYPQPQLALAPLRQTGGLRVQSSLGPVYEHIDIQQGPKGNPLAKNLWVRQALMLSLNRAAIVKQLFGSLNPNLKTLDNVIYLNNQEQYVPHFKKWNYNPTKATQILTSHGCKKGGDGIYVCSGTRLSFAFESTAGNQLRELAFQLIQANLKQGGIEVTNNFKPSSIAFGQDLPNSNYDLFMFAWVGSPDPAANKAIWSCPNALGTQNFMNYCNPKVDAALNAADTQLDPVKRAALENKGDSLIANDIPSIPLYQKPTFLVMHNYVKGMTDNATQYGPWWGAENWWLSK